MRETKYKGYFVDKSGNAFSNKSGKLKSKAICNCQGYSVISIWEKGKGQRVESVHRLVAETFIPNPDNLPCVDHINKIRNDNRIENLRWVTYLDNNVHSPAINVKTTLEQRREICRLYSTGEYLQRELAEMYGVTRSQISNIVNQKLKRN